MARAPAGAANTINAMPASEQAFIRIACDPRRSVVVEACAGSGKTWLLVARIMRLLLAGAAPQELLAITFTRKAAREMRERLHRLLRELATLPEDEVCAMLLARGVAPTDLSAALPAARGLHDQLLFDEQGVTIDTFHGWFSQLIRQAPLSAGIPADVTVTESAGELREEAWRRLMRAAADGADPALRDALARLYERIGDWNTGRLLNAFLDRRAEWWAVNRDAPGQPGLTPLRMLRTLCGGERDARLSLWDDEAQCARIRAIAAVLAEGGVTHRRRGEAMLAALREGPSVTAFEALASQFYDRDGRVRAHRASAAFLAALRRHGWHGGDDNDAIEATFEAGFADIASLLRQRARQAGEPGVVALNQALFSAGAAYLEHYQAVKVERRVLDYGDLEWHAWRLLSDAGHGPWLLSRLDARYRHILLDEFQDANALQWQVLRSWLEACAGDAQAPRVFIVGDPKQSIYRFRRAEPRLFAAARAQLAAQGADVLRTNQTRRNAEAIVDVLNASFIGSPLHQPHVTLAAHAGAVWRLPLIARAAPMDEDALRFEEGRAVCRALLAARRRLASDQASPPRWSEFMLLVKKRTYLSSYEAALREAGLPYVSDKRGGLLHSLEGADLLALLSFLVSPADNLALAQVLRSPLFCASDADLAALARRGEAFWWPRLLALCGDQASDALTRAARLLGGWLRAASESPPHLLLDRILHESEAAARYAQCAPLRDRGRVLANLDAFMELVLELDDGHSGLPALVDALAALRHTDDEEAPDEAGIDPSADAIRLLTVHGAKGLEASVVVLLDANHSEPARDDIGILCDWPADADAPTHFSGYGRRQERGAARDALFAAEEAARRQEDWNLMYVAMTRAKAMLIVSGVAGKRGAGVIDGSWYQRLQVEQTHPDTLATNENTQRDDPLAAFRLPVFDPPRRLAQVAAEATPPASDRGAAQWWPVAMERLTQSGCWPLDVPSPARMAAWLSCSLAEAEAIRARALAVLANPAVNRFYEAAQLCYARNAFEYVDGDETIRFDRLVVCGDVVWIIEYAPGEGTLSSGDSARRRRAAANLFPGMPVGLMRIPFEGAAGGECLPPAFIATE